MLKKSLALLLLVFSFLSGKADVVITPSSGRVLIGTNIDVLNPGKPLSIEQVMKSDAFQPSSTDVPNLGITRHDVWLRFTITNEISITRLLLHLDYPRLDEVELYWKEGDRLLRQRLGRDEDFNARTYKLATFMFDLDIPQGHSQTYYLKVRSKEQLFLPLYVGRGKSQMLHVNGDNMLSGIYLGIVLIMVLYNLFIYFSVKDTSYLLYVTYVLFAGLTQSGLKGYNFQYLWPQSPELDSMSVTLFGAVGGMAALLFTRDFLELKQRHPKFNKAILFFTALFVLSIALVLAGRIPEGFQTMQSITAVSSILVFAIALILMLRKQNGAKFFFIAWSVLLTGSIIFLLKDYGILPYNRLTSYSVQVASAIEMALLSFALADRINILKREKELSQAEALRAATENARIIREQNIILEQKVNERTVELKEANEELNVTLENLKEAQSQLVESEKMASLGQLTAGIAHEINNPINFVTSNVTPLKRDVSLLLDVIASLEDVALSEKEIEDKRRIIEELKEEQDFDYLKLEIDLLLKGIHEGASRTAEIVKGLRIFSRVDEDDLKRADVNEGISSTLVIINNLLNNKIKIIKDYGNLPLIECYPGKLNQVFLNILTNAIHAVQKKFGEQDGGEIHLSTRSEDDRVFIKIADNGTGMDETTQKKIFEPFFTTKDVGEGTGLGMSIAYNTIVKHQGQIQVKSAPGEGTAFTIELPVVHKL